MRGDRPSSPSWGVKPSRFTPHARGSTPSIQNSVPQPNVYPACAGIDPMPPQVVQELVCLPRMRGDRPHHRKSRSVDTTFTPHARGSTSHPPAPPPPPPVYPACAGIDRFMPDCRSSESCLPRMRGDRPAKKVISRGMSGFTPHARGSTPCGLAGFGEY